MTDIYIIGIGQRFPQHLTLEALEALTDCRTIYTLLGDAEVASLPDDIGVKCRSVRKLYQPNRRRSDNYTEVARTVLNAARSGRPVGWLTWGNPRVLDSVSHTLAKTGAETGLVVVTLPAVSSIDTVLIDVSYDPADGVQIIEGTTAVTRQTRIVPEIAVLIFQPGVFGTMYPRMTADSPRVQLGPLRDYLLRYYLADHELAFVCSSEDRNVPARITWTAIEKLNTVASDVLRSSTIFIPPAAKSQIDRSFIALVESAD
ncbi:MAG TPA: SAM-dependent methyltransferase [Candidatus Saccharimonadales bacterium]|nr:SAM-dependent methyltransferase [Candidatus Saccharimonadales bacterium]